MNKIEWLKICLILIFSVLTWKTQAFSQPGEKITVSTYYPSPYGSYQELKIFGKMTFKDTDKFTPKNVDLTTDGEGDLVLSATNLPVSQPIRLYFNDSGVSRPLSYFVKTPSDDPNPCAFGYVAINYLDSQKKPANPKSLPSDGYYLCFRGE